MNRSPIRGVIFDLDGVIVDVKLDFDQIRRECDIPPGQPILEALAGFDDARARRCHGILARHETAAAAGATLMPGIEAVIETLAARGIHRGVLTRNSYQIAVDVLTRFDLAFDPVFGRENAPVKPAPQAVWAICEHWKLTPDAVALVGDYRFDIQAGRNAGTRTVLLKSRHDADTIQAAERPDFSINSFAEAHSFLDWLREPI